MSTGVPALKNFPTKFIGLPALKDLQTLDFAISFPGQALLPLWLELAWTCHFLDVRLPVLITSCHKVPALHSWLISVHLAWKFIMACILILEGSSLMGGGIGLYQHWERLAGA